MRQLAQTNPKMRIDAQKAQQARSWEGEAEYGVIWKGKDNKDEFWSENAYHTLRYRKGKPEDGVIWKGKETRRDKFRSENVNHALRDRKGKTEDGVI